MIRGITCQCKKETGSYGGAIDSGNDRLVDVSKYDAKIDFTPHHPTDRVLYVTSDAKRLDDGPFHIGDASLLDSGTVYIAFAVTI